GRILNCKIRNLENDIMIKLKNTSVEPTLVFDSWTNVVNQNIMGAVFITPKRE
ncbi:10704_t:CDS:1, partial [Gigaspora rosea]